MRNKNNITKQDEINWYRVFLAIAYLIIGNIIIFYFAPQTGIGTFFRALTLILDISLAVFILILVFTTEANHEN